MAGVQSIERAFSILRVLARGPVGVTEIAERTDLPKSTVSRLLAALESEGAVEQPDDGGYAVGGALAILAEAASPSASLRSVVRPFIEELASATGASAGFTVLQGNRVFWADNFEASGELVTITNLTGQSFPLHEVASGLALLSQFEPAALDEYLAKPLESLHDHTVTDPDELRAMIDGARAAGAVVSFERLDAGINAVAAAFRGSTGEWVGALYVQGPSFRFPGDDDIVRVISLVIAAADELSQRLSDR